ncbi:GCN5 family acetyltransferase [Actinoplanes sp. SE50]|uniref:GNAT family N-acetyltransferase n=1 Tax=unclassified Actinoplanes TaxID=2626549 RepID=UPI00023EC747|nr:MULTISPECIES: GNAT family N-acetyltransferase [unclassified Actinoplanes]AEV82550.1 Spermidine/spermine N(1)-acetyltransferase-like protein 1 [Actinoplanes sp. SE50/110]ATO80946.1 GCN5 family acetyltransferase [Actinoplanes sp. SE50]SLL98353.1 GCN5 family acetyltransferase [Actinoplanes sp. SE50/110]
MTLEIGSGFTEAERTRVGLLYWAAFGRKLRLAFRDEATGVTRVTAALLPDRMLIARAGGAVTGVCGFHRDGHGAADLSWSRLRPQAGRASALRALLALAPLERHPQAGVLLLDGVAVDAALRGRGIGSALLAAAEEQARRQHARWVQLSVVDTNPRAEALYRRLGYQPVSKGSIGTLRHLYGFERFTTMRKRISA